MAVDTYFMPAGGFDMNWPAAIWWFCRIWFISSCFLVREAADVSGWAAPVLWLSIEDISCWGRRPPDSKLKLFFTLFVADEMPGTWI